MLSHTVTLRLLAVPAFACLAMGLSAQTVQRDAQLESCEKPLGTLVVIEPSRTSMDQLSSHQLGAPGALLRTMVQHSGCFLVLDRSEGLQASQEEKDRSDRGDLQSGSNMGKGQIKAADFILRPSINIVDADKGGAVLASFIPKIPLIISGLRVKFKEAETNIAIIDARTTLQVASAQGKASKSSIALGGAWFSRTLSGIGGGYSNTNEGKLIAASFLANFNNVVREVRANPHLIKAADPMIGATGADVKAGMGFSTGDVLAPKLAGGAQMLTAPRAGAPASGALSGADEVIFVGEASGDYLKVASANGEGWVLRLLMKKRN